MDQDPKVAIKASDIPWDTEDRNDLLPKEAILRDTTLYIGAPLMQWMEETWGGVLTHVKTSTWVDGAEVWVTKAQEGEPGAVAVRRIGTQNTGAFSFWRPLRKLNIKVPARREFHITPRLFQVDQTLTVFVFPLGERVSAPRSPGPAAETEAAAAAEPAAQGPAAQPAAE